MSQEKSGVPNDLLIALAIGGMIGIISGIIGLGGAIFLIPILVYAYSMDQKGAQGTSVATLLLPIGWKILHAGHVNLKLAAPLALFFLSEVISVAPWHSYRPDSSSGASSPCLSGIAVKMFLQK